MSRIKKESKVLQAVVLTTAMNLLGWTAYPSTASCQTTESPMTPMTQRPEVSVGVFEFWKEVGGQGVEVIRSVGTGRLICSIKIGPDGHRHDIDERTALGLLRELRRFANTVHLDSLAERTSGVTFSYQADGEQTMNLVHRISKDTPAWALDRIVMLETCLTLMKRVRNLPPVYQP